MNTEYRKSLPGFDLDYFDTRSAVDAIQPGAYDKLPYTSRVLAENLVRRCDPATLTDSLKQIIERKQELDFPWYPARVVCHDILGQTALVDLAGLRDAIAEKGGDPAQVNPVVPTQLIVDHSLAVEHAGFDLIGNTRPQAELEGLVGLTVPQQELEAGTRVHLEGRALAHHDDARHDSEAVAHHEFTTTVKGKAAI